jgi:hypothetical protein
MLCNKHRESRVCQLENENEKKTLNEWRRESSKVCYWESQTQHSSVREKQRWRRERERLAGYFMALLSAALMFVTH